MRAGREESPEGSRTQKRARGSAEGGKVGGEKFGGGRAGGGAAYERSAGVVVYRVDEDGGRRYLLLDYGKYWDFAKGHLEEGEDDLTAALRELAEETGLRGEDVALVPGYCREITYYFRSKGRERGRVVCKQVAFFLAETRRHDVRVSEEHVGYAFEPFAAAVAKVKYPTAKELLRLAEAHLAERHEAGSAE